MFSVNAARSLRSTLSAGTALAGAACLTLMLGSHTAMAQERSAAPAETTLDTVLVEGDALDGRANPNADPEAPYKVDFSESPKLTQPLLDTPQTITVVPKEVIEDQNALSLREALRFVPGVTAAAGEGGGPQGDNLRIRGFAANNDMFIDGIRDVAQYNRDIFNTEQVEVIKGPASTFAGRGSTGGIVNQASKTPRLDDFQAGSLTIGTAATRRITADVNEATPSLADGSAVRLNFMAHEANVADRDVTENTRWGFAPSLALGLDSNTRWTFQYFHQSEDNIPDYGLPVVNGRPADVGRENFYGFRDTTSEDVQADIGTVKFEHDFSDSLSFRNQLRYGEVDRDSVVSRPRNPSTATNTVDIVTSGRDSTTSLLINQSDLTSRFETAGFAHTLVTGVELAREEYDNQAIGYTTVVSSLTGPNPGAPYPGTVTPGTFTETTSDSIALYAFDTVELNEQWEVLGGLRWDRFATDSEDSTGTTRDRVDSMPSWRAGITYKPVEIGSIYASYGTSFNPSAENLSLNANTAGIDPEENESFELGTKWELMDRHLLFNAAVFRIDKTNARTPGVLPGDPPQVLQGEQRVDGFELGLTGNITPDWQVFGGYTFLDSEILESNTPAEIGNPLPNTPKNNFTLFTTYQLPEVGGYDLEDWQVGYGLLYADDRFGNASASSGVSSYWVHDAMLGYQVTENVELQLNAYNLFDTLYYERIHPAHVVPGGGRTFLLSTNLEF